MIQDTIQANTTAFSKYKPPIFRRSHSLKRLFSARPRVSRTTPKAKVIDPAAKLRTRTHDAFGSAPGHPMEPSFESALRVAAAEASEQGGEGGAATASGREPLPLVTSSLEELLAMPVKVLKQLLSERGLSTSDCVEKADLAKKIVGTCTNVMYYKCV